MEPATAPDPPVVFRPGKRRKIYRQRQEDDDGPRADQAETTALSAVPGDDGADEAENGLSVADALRLRNARKSRIRGGVEFGRENGTKTDVIAENMEQSIVLREAMAEPPAGMSSRFAPQTGMVGELLDKHMEEYIESELAKRHRAEASLSKSQNTAAELQNTADAGPAKKPAEGQSTMQGKLHEIDLGEEVRARNVAMTERARRQLEGERVEEEDEESSSKPKKVRLRRDGKPWRPRKRRGSDDVKRDEMVERFLNENRLDVYDVPSQPVVGTGLDEEDGAADERLAEEFKRDYLDAQSQRVQKKKPVAQPSKYGAKKDEEVLKGPKLGGSRNTRAAMRDLLFKQEQEKNAKR